MAESSDPNTVVPLPLEQLLGQSKSKADSLIDYRFVCKYYLVVSIQSMFVTLIICSQLDKSDSRNSTAVVCGACMCLIMKPLCGRLVEKEVSCSNVL